MRKAIICDFIVFNPGGFFFTDPNISAFMMIRFYSWFFSRDCRSLIHFYLWLSLSRFYQSLKYRAQRRWQAGMVPFLGFIVFHWKKINEQNMATRGIRKPKVQTIVSTNKERSVSTNSYLFLVGLPITYIISFINIIWRSRRTQCMPVREWKSNNFLEDKETPKMNGLAETDPISC